MKRRSQRREKTQNSTPFPKKQGSGRLFTLTHTHSNNNNQHHLATAYPEGRPPAPTGLLPARPLHSPRQAEAGKLGRKVWPDKEGGRRGGWGNNGVASGMVAAGPWLLRARRGDGRQSSPHGAAASAWGREGRAVPPWASRWESCVEVSPSTC